MIHLYPLLIVFFLFSCKSENRSFVITFENANGLIEGNPVVLNDFQIGEVTKVSLSSDYKILAELELKDTIRLPKDSKFTISSRDLFTKAIIVIPGKSKTYLTSSDKIIGQISPGLKLDTLINIITDEINNSKIDK